MKYVFTCWERIQRNRLPQVYYYTWKMKVKALVDPLCRTFCDPMDYSPPDSSVQGIFQVRILKWDVIPFSRGSFWLREWNCISWIVESLLHFRQILHHLSHQGSPVLYISRVCVCALSRVWLFVTPWTVACQVPLHGISLARILEWVGISFSGDLPNTWIKPASVAYPALAGSFFTTSDTWETQLTMPFKRFQYIHKRTINIKM